MATLCGAVAYKATIVDRLAERVNRWKMVREYQNQTSIQSIPCPRCGEVYHLLEEIYAGDETVEQDKTFLAKALASVHPAHPSYIPVRDPKGVVRRALGQSSERAPGHSQHPDDSLDRTLLNDLSRPLAAPSKAG